ncbi:unnamed protein product [Linum trigynum]|uniref:Uncharacterized protein n=1 Tax=Linum trigynum TaxID=586398 RepID=A0AAV2EGT0_9ROSI
MLENLDALWVRLLKGLYFDNGDLFSATKGKKGSWIWNGFCDAENALKIGLVKGIMSGEGTKFHWDPWLPSYPSFILNSLNLEPSRVCDWISPSSRAWNEEALRDVVPEETVNVIKRVPIGPSTAQDKWFWNFTTTGDYTVSSAYRSLREHRDHVYLSIGGIEARPNWQDWK